MDNLKQRNLIIAMLLMALMLFGWDAAANYFYPPAKKPVAVASADAGPVAAASAKPTRDGGLTSAADIAAEAQDINAVKAQGGRVPVPHRG